MTTLDITVAASADDASEDSGGSINLTTNPLLNVDAVNEWNGWIFRLITIPSGATINVAYMTVQMTSATLDEPDVTFFGLNAITQGIFTIVANDVSGRAKTAASVDWSNTDAGTGDVNTASLVTIIQELVDENGGLTLGDIGIVMKSRANDATRDTSITSYDGSTSVCGRLHIEYTEAGGGIIPIILAQHRRRKN